MSFGSIVSHLDKGISSTVGFPTGAVAGVDCGACDLVNRTIKGALKGYEIGGTSFRVGVTLSAATFAYFFFSGEQPVSLFNANSGLDFSKNKLI